MTWGRGDPRIWRGLTLLTVALLRRLLREGLVRRSLIWPVVLTAGTLVITLMVASIARPSTVVAVGPEVDPQLVDQIRSAGWSIVTASDPHAAAAAGRARAGLDGALLSINGDKPEDMQLEALVRTHHRAPWRPEPRHRQLPSAAEVAGTGTLFCRLVAGLFVLYGVVFGLGMVARDRDDGTLAAELVLPVPYWVPGAARWLAGSAVLTLFYCLSVATFAALIGVDGAGATIRHGAAAGSGATAIGLLVAGQAGLKQGFSGPLAAGIAACTGLIGVGATWPAVGQQLPLASLFAGGSGWPPLAGAVVMGAAAAVVFSIRSARG